MRQVHLIVPFVVLALSAACDLKPQKPALVVKGAKVTRVSFDQATVEVNLDVENPNKFPIVADRIAYEGFVEGKRVGRGDIKRTVKIAAGGSQSVKVPVTLRFVELGDALKTMTGKDKWKWEVRGDASVDLGVHEGAKTTFTLPFKKDGELVAPQLPRVTLKDTALSNVSLKGADLLVTVEVQNPNTFSLPGAKLDAQLTVNKSRLERLKTSVPSIAGEKTKLIKLRQKVGLENLGGAAAKLLKGEPLDARLLGQINLGKRELPIDLRLKLQK